MSFSLQRGANEFLPCDARQISLFTDEAGRIATIDADHQTIARQPRDPIDFMSESPKSCVGRDTLDANPYFRGIHLPGAENAHPVHYNDLVARSDV